MLRETELSFNEMIIQKLREDLTPNMMIVEPNISQLR